MPNDFEKRGGVGSAAAPRASSPDAGEVELRVGVDPLNRLLAERRGLVAQVSELRAKYGSFGTFETLRKIELSRLKTLIRVQAMRDSRKLNNEQVDEEAHEHPDYVEFVRLATTERAKYFRLEAEVEAIDFKINRDQALIRFVSSEMRL